MPSPNHNPKYRFTLRTTFFALIMVALVIVLSNQHQKLRNLQNELQQLRIDNQTLIKNFRELDASIRDPRPRVHPLMARNG